MSYRGWLVTLNFTVDYLRTKLLGPKTWLASWWGISLLFTGEEWNNFYVIYESQEDFRNKKQENNSPYEGCTKIKKCNFCKYVRFSMRYVGIHALLVGVLQKEIYKKVIQNNDHLSVYHFLIPPDLSANHRVNASIVTDKDNLSDSISLLLLWGILQTLTIGSIYFFLKAEFTLYLPWRKSGCKIVLITFLNELKTSQAWRPVLPDS